MASERAPGPASRSLDDLGEPLVDVTFVVVDVETTGSDPEHGRLTEIGAVKLRAGERLGTFQTLVNPGVPIPPFITLLTGIADATVEDAPSAADVLPHFVDFAAGSVLVGHNVGFDLRFLNAELRRAGLDPLGNPVVDTLSLARRLLAGEVLRFRLGELASALGLPARQAHRALADAETTADLLHVLLERAGGLGISGLNDLRSLPRLPSQVQARKLRLTANLPRTPGVYLMSDRAGHLLYVGKAIDVQARVRSYFTGERRRLVPGLLRLTDHIDSIECPHELAALVLEARLIARCQPQFNSAGKHPERFVALLAQRRRGGELTLELSRRAQALAGAVGASTLLLGPLAPPGLARMAARAMAAVVPLRLCRMPTRCQDALCSCHSHEWLGSPEGRADPAGYLAEAFGARPDLLLEPLARGLRDLAENCHFEEAEELRRSAEALASLLRRSAHSAALADAGLVVLEGPTRERIELQEGLVVGIEELEAHLRPTLSASRTGREKTIVDDSELAVLGARALERSLVASWIARHDDELRLEHAEHGFALPAVAVPSFRPSPASGERRPLQA